jgi:Ca-dependent carbohydrate-binding module xylan-binding
MVLPYLRQIVVLLLAIAVTSAAAAKPRLQPISGQCGSASGQQLMSAPNGSALCYSGAETAVSGSGPWSWTCLGANGGANSPTCTASLTADPTDSVVIGMSEDAYLGDAQYAVAVDGITVATGTVTTLNSSGASQEVAVGLGGGSHQVTVTFLNDAYDPGVGDRNLYVNYAKYDGVDQDATSTELYTTGNMFSITVPMAPPTVSTAPPSGGVPPGAQAAGYTTLAFESDFTQPGYANLSNWLDCAGAASPEWFIGGAIGHSPPPCSRISMISDGGVQVLDIKFTSADAANLGTVLTTLNSALTRGVDFPNGTYWEITYRLTAAGRDNNPYGTELTGFFTWSNSGQLGASSSYMELDFLETYASGCCHEGSIIHMWGAVPYGQGDLVVSGYGLPEYQVDQTAYHTIASRITQDGTSNLAMCMYIDGQLQNCRDMVSAGNSGAAAITPAQLNERNFPALAVGPVNTTPVAATMDMLVKDVRIWTCANWQGTLNTPGHACNGAVLTSAP